MTSGRKDRSGGGSRKPKRAADHGVMVPLDSWSRLIDQLGNLHQAGRDLAEARERAAKAETEVTFLRERLRDALARIRQLELDASEGRSAAPVEGSPHGSGAHAEEGSNSQPEVHVGHHNGQPRNGHIRNGAGPSGDGAPPPAPSSPLPPFRPGPSRWPDGGGYAAPLQRRQIPSPPQVAARFRRWWRYVEN